MPTPRCLTQVWLYTSEATLPRLPARMSAQTIEATGPVPGCNLQFQTGAGPGIVPAMPRAQDLPGRRNMRPECTLVIPSQTRPDPSDLPEHIDRASPCSMLKDDPRPLAPLKTGNPTQRPQVSIVIPEEKQPDPSDHPEHCDQLSPGSLLSGRETF